MSSMCSMPTQRSDSGGSPAASSDGTSAFTTGPRTVERMVSACAAAPRTLMLDLAFVEFAPGVAVAIAPRIARIDLLDIQVARRGHVVGDRPGDAAVAAPPHAGKAGMSGAGRVILRPVQRVFVPARRHPERLMRIAAQHRLAAGGAAAMQRPVVAAGRIVGAGGVLQHAMLRGFRRQVQRAERLRQQARRLGGHDAVDAAVQRPPDAARDRHDVAHGERLRRVVELAEFGRQVAPHQLDLPIDPGDQRGDHAHASPRPAHRLRARRSGRCRRSDARCRWRGRRARGSPPVGRARAGAADPSATADPAPSRRRDRNTDRACWRRRCAGCRNDHAVSRRGRRPRR